jgi:formamidopyrimidine-DNA glycosylase
MGRLFWPSCKDTPMPELPEVETVRRGLAPVLVGARIEGVEQRRANLRFPFPERFVERLTGTRVTALSRRAKYLLAALDSGETLILHLGMSGSFRTEAEDQTSPGVFHFARSKNVVHDHVVLRLSGGARVTYNDPRRFGFMQLAKTDDLSIHPLFSRLGLEPFDGEFDAGALAKLLAGRKSPLKAALLDQSLIAGLGNIYVCEALHRAGLSPRLEAGAVANSRGGPTVKAKRLTDAIRAVLEEAVAAGGSTLRDHRQTDGELGYFQHAFLVYGKEGAACARARCGGTILRIAQSGRSTFYCPTCQR